MAAEAAAPSEPAHGVAVGAALGVVHNAVQGATLGEVHSAGEGATLSSVRDAALKKHSPSVALSEVQDVAWSPDRSAAWSASHSASLGIGPGRAQCKHSRTA